VGTHFLSAYGIQAASRQAHAFTYLDFAEMARVYGKMGGFAHLATLVKAIRASRPGSPPLDGGDSWQGSATALWTNGQDMVDAQKLLGVDIATGHWEFTYGQERVKQIVENDFKGRIEFLAQNVDTADFGDPVFKPYTIREMNGVTVGIIGQAFPYTPIANPRLLRARLDLRHPGGRAAEARRRGARQGRAGCRAALPQRDDVDLKLASRVTRHRRDPRRPHPRCGAGAGGSPECQRRHARHQRGQQRQVRGACWTCDVREGRVREIRYRLLTVFSNCCPPTRDGRVHLEDAARRTWRSSARTSRRRAGCLYRRGNFNGTADQLIPRRPDAVKGAQIAFSPASAGARR
jgi:sulfur-oxidizing protein SoxB